MSYQALYRVFRPQQFRDVVGQEHITRTLQNALLQEKFSHAYLFSGPRGTGKTSAAKILAKAVNCERAPIAEPCNECASCRGITDGSISDVIEIDAASNNGVDEIRDIRDKVKFAPSSVRFKVYIIDEVHMLSIGAFNALLKTLEEPPKHVIFILATTEPHKIPLTIISRCQRFDFKRISLQAIVGRMKVIVEDQHVEVDENALQVIARAAEGGMRDALSMLDQAISFSDERVNLEDVLAITGSVSQGYLTNLVRSIHEKDISSALQSLDQLISSGKDPMRFIEDLIYYYRDMLLYQTAPQLEEILERVQVDSDFKQLATTISKETIYEIIELLNKSQQEMKWTNHPRIFLEVAMVKLCQIEKDIQEIPQVHELIRKISQLESEVKQLREKGISSAKNAEPQGKERRAMRQVKSGYKTPTGRIQEILKNATKKDLDLLKRSWGEMLGMLKNQNKASHAALLNESEPVAASDNAFVLKFKYEIHCKMVAENNNFVKDNVENILSEITKKKYELVGVPDEEWFNIRENFIRNQKGDTPKVEEDPIIVEAKKLFGEDLVEIKE